MEALREPERSDQERYDGACSVFTGRMQTVANWKHSYYGAAYTTRLRQAIKEARDACDTLEVTLKQLGEN